MKLILGIIILFSSAAFAGTWLTVEKNASGRAKLYHKVDASEQCALQGARLPTLREFAQYAQTQGAVGIKETAFPKAIWLTPNITEEAKANEKLGFKDIWIWNDNASRTKEKIVFDFYYSSEGYNSNLHLENGFTLDTFWAEQSRGNRFSDGFSIDSGTILNGEGPNHMRAVRCIAEE